MSALNYAYHSFWQLFVVKLIDVVQNNKTEAQKFETCFKSFAVLEGNEFKCVTMSPDFQAFFFQIYLTDE